MPLVLESGELGLGAQQASQALVGGANALISSPAPPVLEGHSRLLLLFSPGLPSMPPGPTWPRGGGGGLEVKEAGILDGIKERAYLLLS